LRAAEKRIGEKGCEAGGEITIIPIGNVLLSGNLPSPPDASKRLAWGGRQALWCEDRKTKESQCAFVFC
jgi:hypothetical protein